MKNKSLFAALLVAASLFGAASQAAETAPKRGGTLNFLVEPEPPVLTSLVNSGGSVIKVNAKVI
ncbi:ABC transporter substrate-binding protein, partial [Dickeya dianthicola]|nr:ABC transporter substrate-binding protein [Dickeya dianthicola]